MERADAAGPLRRVGRSTVPVMALIHDAQLSLSKLDILRAWTPTQAWAAHFDAGGVEVAGTFRFDDPEGEVGVETFLMLSGGRMYHIPLTYRGAPLAGADEHLVSTIEHSILGRRWVYDAVHDPVYIEALTRTIVGGGTQADLEYDYPVPAQSRNVTTRVRGTGRPGATMPEVRPFSTTSDDRRTVVRAATFQLGISRLLDTAANPTDADPTATVLTGTWPGQDTPVVLATVVGASCAPVE